MRKLLSIGALGFASLFAVWQPPAANAQVIIGGHRLPPAPPYGPRLGHHNEHHHKAARGGGKGAEHHHYEHH